MQSSKSLIVLRKNYHDVCKALPWLDMAVWPDDPPAFPAYARDITGAQVKSLRLGRDKVGRLAEQRALSGALIARHDPAFGTLAVTLANFAAELTRTRTPLAVLHTDVEWQELENLAENYPDVFFIIESGAVKLLYYIQFVEDIMLRRANVGLCLFNFCNWLGIERLIGKKLGGRLFFGAHQPRFNPHAVMGPIVMSGLDWRQKCDLAGNNLRRLLGIPEVYPAAVDFQPPAPFVIDAHTHNGAYERFPVPDADPEFTARDWLAFMDGACVERLYLCPLGTLLHPDIAPLQAGGAIMAAAPDRFRYFDVFHPQGDARHRRRIIESCADQNCIGIKIHPSTHKVEADDDAFAPVYEIAQACHKPIMTHSWDVSPTNPVQYMSHPDRFRKHLTLYPQTRFVLGHAGGRPGSMEAVVALCREFPGVCVDLAGDYYDNGLIECLVARLGAERVLLGSDVNWIDVRANLAPVLAAAISDCDVAAIIRHNALRVYENSAG